VWSALGNFLPNNAKWKGGKKVTTIEKCDQPYVGQVIKANIGNHMVVGLVRALDTMLGEWFSISALPHKNL
jgi:hypothetical protein